MNNINNEILSAIDKIETVTMESEMNVLTAMCDAYEKSAIILENYEGDDVSCFDIFQEGFKDDVKEAFKGKDGEHIVKKILMVIPRLLAAIGKAIKRFFNKKKDQQVINNLKAVEKMDINTVSMKDLEGKRDESISNISSSHVDVDVDVSAEEIKKMIADNLAKSNSTFEKNAQEIDNMQKDIETLLDSMCEDKTIKTTLRLEDVSHVLKLMFDQLNEFDVIFETIATTNDANKELDNLIYKYGRHPIWNICDDRNDVRRFLSFSKPKEYTIDEACEFIKGKAEMCQRLIDVVDDKIRRINLMIKHEEEQIKKSNAYKERHRDEQNKVSYADKDIGYSKEAIRMYQRMIDMMRRFTILIPNLLIIIEVETSTWNEAAKIALGLKRNGSTDPSISEMRAKIKEQEKEFSDKMGQTRKYIDQI